MLYPAYNKAQEAFQLFYKRLLLIQDTHDNNDHMYLKNNGFHLSTLINTFNTRYCYEASTTGGNIDPIFLNFNDSPHRLLAIDIRCDTINNGKDDTILFIFDNPRNDEIPILAIKIQDFNNRIYNKSIYIINKKDYIGLEYDDNNPSNFYYTETEERLNDFILNSYIDEYGKVRSYPPFYTDTNIA